MNAPDQALLDLVVGAVLDEAGILCQSLSCGVDAQRLVGAGVKECGLHRWVQVWAPGTGWVQGAPC